jgi:hypothetical protein
MITILILIALFSTAYIVKAQTSVKSDAALSYSRRLTELSGQPVAVRSYDFIFKLYSAEKDDQELWSDIVRRSGKVGKCECLPWAKCSHHERRVRS